METENNIRCERAGVFTLPMRNWNLAYIFIFPFSNSSFYPTYEELKSLNFYLYLFSVFVFTLPMRNWNFKVFHDLLLNSIVFTLPMRNWNTIGLKTEDRPSLSFYPTYEELKSSLFLKHNSLRKDSFYPTYEELKYCSIYIYIQFSIVKFLPYLWGIEMHCINRSNCSWHLSFYPTYEELKFL